MASTRFYLDKRQTRPGNPSPMKIVINHANRYALFSTDVKLFPNQWDQAKQRVINHPNKMFLSAYLSKLHFQIDSILLQLSSDFVIGRMNAVELRDYLVECLNPEARKEAENKRSFLYQFKKYMERLKPSSKETYDHTLNRIIAFVGEKELKLLTFEDINFDWLTRFDNFMIGNDNSRNTRNIHYRNIRAVFNYAIEEDITQCYPFRRFKIKNEVTAKRNLTVEELRILFFYKCEESAVKYRDFFMLMFFLMGINNIDLCNLKEIIRDRIEFHRSKTNHFFSMKVEPEAMAIIEKYRGKKHLINILDHWESDEFFRKKMNKVLQKIGPVTFYELDGKKSYNPLFPKLTTYYSRHSWASIASSIDIPIETISAGLGHEYGNRITAVYINFDNRKVDKANRKVIDWVLYGKIDGEEVVKPFTPEFFGLSAQEADKLGLLDTANKGMVKHRGRPKKVK